MAAKGYTTEEKIETFLNKDISTGDADDAILAAEKLIDMLTGRNFKAESSASYRYFTGNNSQDLIIDDCTEVSEVNLANDEYGDSLSTLSAGGVNGYVLFPKNRTDPPVPIRKIHYRGGVWTAGRENHKIKAKWGYSAAPPGDIVMAATIIAGGIYNYNRGGVSGDIKTEKIGDYSVTYDVEGTGGRWGDYERAITILDGYKKFFV